MNIITKIKNNLKRYGIHLPTFRDGAGSVINLYPHDIPKPLSDEEAFKADRDAIRGDWQAIGNDMRKIIKTKKK
jgi:hypothetical protein